ncbi:MAG: TonB-dependent receptor [Dysgonamonadaceae bacterium]|jgi:outer membrane cobalamin receptor|nr:TonB-dependent receptor [Dysgonamonadaceae bacterium]
MVKTKRNVILFISIFQAVIVFGQGSVNGIVADKATNTPVEYVSITIYTQADNKYVSGTVTDSTGKFFIDKLAYGKYKLEYSFIGFDKRELLTISINKEQSMLNLGTLFLTETSLTLEEVVVTGKKSTYITKIDKKIFNVGEDLMSAAGSASELLENIPSIQVDLDGNVTLRGSENVQILINGRASSLMGATRATVLQQIPAKTIERIEVITNPSAKYKPDGTAGIINIVLKKERQTGMNGTFAANAGNKDRYNSTLTLNYNPGKINFSGSYGIRSDNRDRYNYDNRTKTDIVAGQNTFIDQNTNSSARPFSHLVRGGMDWDITKNDNFQINGSYSYSSFQRNEDILNIHRNTPQDTTEHFIRHRKDDEYEKDMELSAIYEHNFGEDHSLTVDYTYSGAKELEDNKYTNRHFFPKSPDLKDNTLIWQNGNENLIRANYIRPLDEKTKVEIGSEIELDTDKMNYFAEYLSGNTWITDTEKTNYFIFDENIYALYATYETTFEKFSIMGGVRGETAHIKSKLITSDTLISNNYFNIFPTLHTSHHFDDNNELQLNYSLRINRPEGDDLNPFPEYKDPLNVSSGNPYLKPEKIHSIEFGYLLKSNLTTLLSTVYYRNIVDRMTEITKFINDSVMWTIKDNMSSSQSGGFEFILNSPVGKWLVINFNSNIFYNVIDASDLGFNDPKSTVSWNASLNGNVNISKNLMAQINTRYIAKSLTPQGYKEPSFILNAGTRYNLLHNKASILFTVSDLLNTYKSVLKIDTPELKQRLERKRTSQVFYLGFTYNFGNSEKKQKAPALKYDERL